MTEKYKQIVEDVNNSPAMLALVVAGGGQSFIQNFMQYPGASKTITDIRVPYSKEAFEDFCGQPVDKFVSEESARLLAVKSYLNCCKSVSPKYAIGIGLTCSLATQNEREGREHKVYIAVHTEASTEVVCRIFRQGMTRDEEEEFCRDAIFNRLAFILCGPNIPYLGYSERAEYYCTDHLYKCEYTRLTDINKIPDQTLVIVPGSFNPYHDGHKAMAEYAEKYFGVKPYLELTVNNADKGILDHIEVQKRLTTIKGYDTIVTSSRTFLDKARLFAKTGRQIVFVVGSDTWNRVLDPKYAGDMESLMYQFIELNVRFLVLYREGHEIIKNQYLNKFRYTADGWNGLNVSSTEIRNGN